MALDIVGLLPAEVRIIEQLQELRWRGRRCACDVASFTFSHDQARRKYPYVSGAGHDWTGLNEIPIKAHLYFLNTVEPKSFPEEFNFWLENLLDGTPGKLQHPILGEIDAVVMEGSVDLVAQVKSGVIVNVTWEKTRLDLEQDDAFKRLVVNVESVAAQCDADLKTLGVKMPDNVPVISSLLETYKKVKGSIFSAQLTFEGAIHQIQALVEDLVVAVDNLNDPRTWPAQANLVTLWDNLRQIAENAEKTAARPVGKVVVANDTTLDAVASDFGNALNDVISLNLNLLISPTVPKNSTVRYYLK